MTVGKVFFFAFATGMLLGACDIHYYEPRYWAINFCTAAWWAFGYYEGTRAIDRAKGQG